MTNHRHEPQGPWEEAARDLFEDEYVLVRNGPRRHDDWHRDLVAVLGRAVQDPRGWLALDWDRNGIPGSFFPFVDDRFSALGSMMNEIRPPSTTQLLVAMVNDTCDVRAIDDFTEKRPGLLRRAETLLARYGSTAEFYTNITGARADPTPDIFARPPGCWSFTEYTMDFGLVAVSETEIGVFWRFWPE
jgi:hypothetical protein